MKRLLLPMLLALLGLGGGIGTGLMLRPAPEDGTAAGGHAAASAEGHATAPAEEHGAAPAEGHGAAPAEGHGTAAAPGEEAASAGGHGSAGSEGEATHDYVKLNNQFIVPIVATGQVSGLVVLSLSLEVKLGASEKVYTLEPKLRDVFLQVLFDHANNGGFDGAFTDANRMDVLRHSLLEAGRKELADNLSDVLITDIVRQDT